jgi:negative regulator of genetic competence, sporulation and motility
MCNLGDTEMVLDAVNDVGDDDLGFDEVFVDTEGFGAFFIAVLAECRQHDDFKVGSFGGITEYIKYVEAADFRHHDIKQHEVWMKIEGVGQGFFPVGDTAKLKTFGREAGHIDIGEGVVIFDEKDSFRVGG